MKNKLNELKQQLLEYLFVSENTTKQDEKLSIIASFTVALFIWIFSDLSSALLGFLVGVGFCVILRISIEVFGIFYEIFKSEK